MPDSDINKKLSDLLSQADMLFVRTYSVAELNVLRGYKYTLADVRKEIAKIFEEHGTYPTISDMRKFDRLEKLEKQLTHLIGVMQQKEINLISSEIKNSLKTSFEKTGQIITDVTDLRFNFDRIPKESIEWVLKNNRWTDRIKNHNAKLLTDVLSETESMLRTNARQDIASGLARGLSYADVTRNIKNRFDITATRAKMITYDQMHAGHMVGRNEGIKKAGAAAKRLGLEFEKVWKHNPVKRPRPTHVIMGLNKTPADENGIFTLPSGSRGEAPGLMDDASENIFCRCSVLFFVKGV